jgi:hypothetical protein
VTPLPTTRIGAPWRRSLIRSPLEHRRVFGSCLSGCSRSAATSLASAAKQCDFTRAAHINRATSLTFKMVHQGGATSRTSRALANVRQQLKTKQTRGRKPRALTDAELAKLEDQQGDLLRQLEAHAVERAEGQRSRKRALKVNAALLHARLKRALEGSMRADRDLRLATEAQEWLWKHLCRTVIDQVNFSSREEPTIMVYLLARSKSQPDRTNISVDDIKAFRKKMYLLLHPDRNHQPGAGAAFVKFRRKTDDLLARLTRMPPNSYRPTADPTRLQLTLQIQLKEREVLQETIPSLAKKLQMAAEELRDAQAAWDAAQTALPASGRKTRPVVRTGYGSLARLCHRCGGGPCQLTCFWCAACSRQLAGG